MSCIVRAHVDAEIHHKELSTGKLFYKYQIKDTLDSRLHVEGLRAIYMPNACAYSDNRTGLLHVSKSVPNAGISMSASSMAQ